MKMKTVLDVQWPTNRELGKHIWIRGDERKGVWVLDLMPGLVDPPSDADARSCLESIADIIRTTHARGKKMLFIVLGRCNLISIAVPMAQHVIEVMGQPDLFAIAPRCMHGTILAFPEPSSEEGKWILETVNAVVEMQDKAAPVQLCTISEVFAVAGRLMGRAARPQ